MHVAAPAGVAVLSRGAFARNGGAAAKAKVPLARVGQPEDYSEVIVYLCVGASYITGEVVPVTGGTRI
jgi:NAD(P)-dependent dehydrogenase (short-subunit alcohol dehydrogenase family)